MRQAGRAMRVGFLLLVTAMAAAGLYWSRPRGEKLEEVAATRPAKWAQPLKRPGLPNLNKITDNLYRGAQPSAEGMAELKRMGIRTVVNLRSLHSDRDEIGDLDLDYVHIRFEPWNAERDEIAEFLKVVTDPARQPVFFHCQHGADRTGTMCAVYRIAVQGWSKEEAIEEMTRGGYGFHKVWQNLIKYIRWLDIAEVHAMAGLPAEIPAPDAAPKKEDAADE